MDKKEITQYKSVKQYSETEEIVINKSRFIGYCAHTMSEDDAKAFIEEVGLKHPEASCICHAYICGMTQNVQKFHDGHEPVGGMPILEVMKMKGLTGVTCVVVRYFGGVKLGVGGLARAFSGTASKSVDMAIPCNYILSEKYILTYDYTFQGKLEYMFSNSHFIIGEAEFTEKIKVEVTAKKGEYDELNSRISAVTNGKHELNLKEKVYMCWDD